jgi:bla regulator protein blaR1
LALAGTYLLHHLWESTVVAALLVAVARLPLGLPTRLRHALLTLASLKFLLPTGLLALLAVRAGFAGSLVRGVDRWLPSSLAPWLPSAVAGPEGLGAGLGWWLAAPLALWCAGVVVLAVRWRRGRLRVAELVARAEVIQDGAAAELLARGGARLGLRRPVRLVASPEVSEPAVWGVRRPVVLLPRGLAEHLSEHELEAVLLHELVHVERRDNLTAGVHRLLRCLFWFHPLVRRLGTLLAAERERLVDERVLALGSEGRVYALGLLKVLRLGLGLPAPSASSAATGGSLGARVERILTPDETRWPGPAQVLLVAATLALLLGLTLLPMRRAVCPILYADGGRVEAPPSPCRS